MILSNRYAIYEFNNLNSIDLLIINVCIIVEFMNAKGMKSFLLKSDYIVTWWFESIAFIYIGKHY